MDQKKMKKFLLVFAISGAIIMWITLLINIWLSVGKDFILKTFCTYLVFGIAFFLMEQSPLVYKNSAKNFPNASNIWVWLSMWSIAFISVLLIILIWRSPIWDENIRKLMASVAVIDFMYYLSVLALNKWWVDDEPKQVHHHVNHEIQSPVNHPHGHTEESN